MLHNVLLYLAIVATVLFAFFGTRAITGAISKAPRKVMFKRAVAVILAVALTGSSWAGWFGTAGPKAEPAALPGGEPLVATAAATEPKDEPLNAVNLTAMQMDAFLADYSLLFDNSNLVSRAQERISAQKQYGVEFNFPVDFPWEKVLDKQDAIKSGKLSGAELDAFYKEVRHELYQDIVAKPTVLHMWLQLLNGIDLATENNPWIAKDLQELDGYFAKTTDPQGLDCMLEYSSSGGKDIMVKREIAEMAAHVCVLLDQMSFRGIVNRTSVRNWEIPLIGEDSHTEAKEAADQESRAALLLSIVNKSGKEVLALGVNLYDRRAEQFPTNVKETPVATPETPNTTPPKDDTPEPQLPPEQPQAKDYNLVIQYLETGTGKTMFQQYGPVKVKQGNTYSVTSPQKEGYTCSLPTVAGTMPAQDQTVTVWYTPTPVEKTKHILQVQYYLEDGSPAPGITWISEVLETGTKYSYDTPPLKGYTPDRKVVSGTMPDRDHIEKVIYKANYYELLIHYKDRETRKTLHDDYVHDYKYLQWYDVKSPEIPGYTTDTPRVSGQMPDRDLEVTVWYDRVKASEHTLTIHYLYISGGKAADDYVGTYKENQRYSVRSPEVSGWTPVTSLVEGVMGNRDLEFTVYYTKDGNGVNKDPNADPGPQGNAPEKGGTNDTTQGEGGATGVEQPEKPPVHDYGNGDQSTGQDRNDLDKDGNSTEPNVPGKGDDESSGTGGVDHPQEDGEGGNTENGDIPDKDPIPEHDDNTPATGGDNGWADEEIGEPPV